MKRPLLFAATFSLALLAGPSTTGCIPAKSAAEIGLSGAQYACVLLTTLWDAPAVATACGIAQNLIPIVRSVLVGKATAAKSQGAALPPEAKVLLDSADAGAE